MPAVTRAMASYAATFGFRHDMELRYVPDRAFAQEGRMPTADDYKTVTAPPDLSAMAEASSERAREWLKAVCDFQRAHAKYLLRGRFADDEGFTCENPALIAKRFVADDGTSAVCVWNVSDKPAEVKLEGLGAPTAVAAPGAEPADGPLAPSALSVLCEARARLAPFVASAAPLDLVLAANAVRAAAEALGSLVGATCSADLLDRLFSRFCVGK